MSASDISSPAQLPQEVNFALAGSIPAGWESRQLRQATHSQLPPVCNSSTLFQINIPQLPNTFIDPTTACLNIKTEFVCTLDGVTFDAIDDSPMILGGGWSLFSRYEAWFNNSALLDQIQRPGQLFNALSNLTLNRSEKLGMAGMMGFSEDCLPNHGVRLGSPAAGEVLKDSGVKVTRTNAGQTLTFALDMTLPLLGVMGAATGKLIPLFLGGFRLDLTADDFMNFFVNGGKDCGTSYRVTHLEFACQTIVVPPDSLSAILSQAGDAGGKMFIRSSSWIHASHTIMAGRGVGLEEILIPPRVSSCKGILHYTSPSNNYELMYGAVCPNLVAGTCVSLNGKYYPQNTLDPSWHPMQVYQQNQLALNAYHSGAHSGHITRLQFCRGSTAYGSLNAYVLSAASGAAKVAARDYPNAYFIFTDTEIYGRRNVFLSGVSTRSGSSFLRYNIGAQLAAVAHNVTMFVYYDSVLVIDLGNGTISRSY